MNHKILWVLKASIGWRCPSFWPNHPICLAVKNRWAQLQKVGALNIHHPILGALNIQSTFLEPIFWELFEYPSSKKVAFVKKAASREQHQQQQLSSGWRYGGNHHGINLKGKAQISHWCSSICCHCEIIDIIYIYIYIYTEYIIYIYIIHSYYIYIYWTTSIFPWKKNSLLFRGFYRQLKISPTSSRFPQLNSSWLTKQFAIHWSKILSS